MRVVLVGIKVEAGFSLVDDEDQTTEGGKIVSLEFRTLTEFQSQAGPRLREAWQQLRDQANAPATPAVGEGSQ